MNEMLARLQESAARQSRFIGDASHELRSPLTALRTHRANGWAVLGRQFASPILILLLITAGLSLFLGDPHQP